MVRLRQSDKLALFLTIKVLSFERFSSHGAIVTKTQLGQKISDLPYMLSEIGVKNHGKS